MHYKCCMPTSSQATELLTAGQVAQIFQVTKSTISRWGLNGTLRQVKVNGTVRYRRDDVDRLLAEDAS